MALAFKSFFSSSKGNLNSLTDGETTILLDCGVPWPKVKRAMNFRTHELSGALITHQHGDHTKGVPGALNAGIDCHMLQETKDALEIDSHRLHTFNFQDQFKIGTLTIKPFPLEHCHTDGAPCENAGFLILSDHGEKMVYITDTYYCRFHFPALNLIAVECNYSNEILDENIKSGVTHPAMKKRLLHSHFELENVKNFFRANDLSAVREIHLLHMSADNADSEGFCNEIQALTGKPVYCKK